VAPVQVSCITDSESRSQAQATTMLYDMLPVNEDRDRHQIGWAVAVSQTTGLNCAPSNLMCMVTNNHILVAGGGRVGFRVAQFFRQRGHEVTIIERDQDRANEQDSDDIEVVVGDATKPSVLSNALTDDTTVIGALTDSDSTNLAVCLAARTFRPDIRTVARITDADGDEYEQLVDEVVFPERASVKTAVNALSGSDVRTFEEVTGEMEVFDIRVASESPIAGQLLNDVDLPEGSLVISGAGGDRTATSETRLEAGERYIIAADPDASDAVISAFRGE